MVNYFIIHTFRPFITLQEIRFHLKNAYKNCVSRGSISFVFGEDLNEVINNTPEEEDCDYKLPPIKFIKSLSEYRDSLIKVSEDWFAGSF